MTVEAYPLHWPEGWPRAPHQEPARFKTTMARARDGLFHQIRLMGGRNTTLSTNVELRRDGLPYAGRKAPDDPGVAVYFTYKKRSMVFACDRWTRVAANIQAIRLSIEALRGIERWGASDMLERAFTGFEALPSPDGKTWRVVLGVPPGASEAEIVSAYLRKRRDAHPDRGGDVDAFNRVQKAWEEYRNDR